MAKTNPDLKMIRRAVCASRGGWETVSDDQLMGFWHSLPAAERDGLLAGTKQETQADDRHRPKSGG